MFSWLAFFLSFLFDYFFLHGNDMNSISGCAIALQDYIV